MEGVGEILLGLRSLKERQDKTEGILEEIRKEITDMRKEMGKNKVSFAEIVKEQLTQEQLDRDKGRREGVKTRAEEREFQIQLNKASEREKRRRIL